MADVPPPAPLPPKQTAKPQPPFLGLVAIGSGIVVLLFLLYFLSGRQQVSPPPPGGTATPPTVAETPRPAIDLKTFVSQEELEDFLKSQVGTADSFLGLGITGGALRRDMARLPEITAPQAKTEAGAPMAAPEYGFGGGGAEEFSTTNIQVAGVDEADIVKNDGRYIYLVSGNKLVIIDAYPAENARITAEFSVEGTPQEIFINQDHLVVFGQTTEDLSEPPAFEKKIAPPYYSRDKAFISVFDLSNRASPRRVRRTTIEGNYDDSRMIGDYVYAVIQHPPFYGDTLDLPSLRENGETAVILPTDISYFPIPYYEPRLTTIVAVNTQNKDESITRKTYLTDGTDNLYVSAKNIYLVRQHRVPPYQFDARMIKDLYQPILPSGLVEQLEALGSSGQPSAQEWQTLMEKVEDYLSGLTPEQRDELGRRVETMAEDYARRIAKETEKTVVHRIRIKDGRVQYQAQGEVPGRVLNQFSMDEYQDSFRIATTTGEMGSSQNALNHLYLLDENLEIIGRLEDVAPGESIFSARFIGTRAYLVTFQKTDPLFVFDLKNPRKPKVLGKLKIPGYSDYLHPYDENHLIGIGKEAVEAKEGDFAWYQGVKVALFDVSDPTKPKEITTLEIGDRGTESEVLRDHKAFLFDRSKNLMVLPILLAEIDEDKYPQGVGPSTYGDYVWQGAYVFDISTRGISERGRISHVEDKEVFLKSGYYIGSPATIRRSLYICDALYTVSDQVVKMNDLVSLDEVNKVSLPAKIVDVRPSSPGIAIPETRLEAPGP